MSASVGAKPDPADGYVSYGGDMAGQSQQGFAAAVEQAAAGQGAPARQDASFPPAPPPLAAADAAREIRALYRQVLGRDADAAGLAAQEGALAAGTPLPELRLRLAQSDEAGKALNDLYRRELGRDADASGLAAQRSALLGGASLQELGGSIGRSDEAARTIGAFYGQVLGRASDPASLAYWQDDLASGQSVGEVRANIARSAEALGQVQAVYAQHLGRPADPSEAAGFQAAKWTPGDTYTVNSGAGPIATTDARTMVAQAGVYVTLNGGLTPSVTGPDGQVTQFRNATEFAAFAFSKAVAAGQASPAAAKTYDLTVSWLQQVGQSSIQAAGNLQAASQASAAAGQAEQAYLEGIGAELALQVQAMPPEARGPATRRVPLGQHVADVTVTGDPHDPRGLAGFSYTKTDTDPRRTELLAHAQAALRDADTARSVNNTLLVTLHEAQARIDIAYAGLPPDRRTDKMLGVAQQFVDAGQAAAARNDWNLVQTLGTAADVSLQIAAQPEGSRTKLTERFMHKGVKHDITVDPNTPDPFASFSDHSKGQDAGPIVEQVVGVVLNVAAFIPPLSPVAAPAAAAWNAAQAGKAFSQGNALGGVLNLGAAAGAGLAGVGAVAGGTGTAATAAGNMARALGTTPAQLGALGQQVLQGTALVGGAAGIAQGAARGDALGIAAGVLQSAAAVAGGLVSTGQLPDQVSGIVGQVARGANLAAVGVSAGDAFARGDINGGLLASLGTLMSEVSKAVAERTATPPTTPTPPSEVPPPGFQSAATVPVTQEALPAPETGGTPVGTDALNIRSPLVSDNDGLTHSLPDGTPLVLASATLAATPVIPVAVAELAKTAAGRAVLAGLGVVLAPEAVAAGTVALGVTTVKLLVDQGVLSPGPTAPIRVEGYDGTELGRTPLALAFDPATGTPLLYNALGPGGTPLAEGRGARLALDAATGSLTDAQGRLVGRYNDGTMTPAEGVDLRALIRGSPLIATPPGFDPQEGFTPVPPLVRPGEGGFTPTPALPDQEGLVPPALPPGLRPGEGGLTTTPALPNVLPGTPIDGLQGPDIFENRSIEDFRAKLNDQYTHLTRKDYDAARQEMAGSIVGVKEDGKPYDHVQEVATALNGVADTIDALKRRLSYPNISDADRQAVAEMLSEASKKFEETRRMVPGIDQERGKYR